MFVAAYDIPRACGKGLCSALRSIVVGAKSTREFQFFFCRYLDVYGYQFTGAVDGGIRAGGVVMSRYALLKFICIFFSVVSVLYRRSKVRLIISLLMITSNTCKLQQR